MEVEIQVANVSSAIIAAANLAWPARTIGLRSLDREGREVFGRQRPIADRAKTIPAIADFPDPLGYWAANGTASSTRRDEGLEVRELRRKGILGNEWVTIRRRRAGRE